MTELKCGCEIPEDQLPEPGEYGDNERIWYWLEGDQERAKCLQCGRVWTVR